MVGAKLAELYVELRAKGGNVDAVLADTQKQLKLTDNIMSEMAVKGPALLAAKVKLASKEQAANFQVLATAHGNFGATLLTLRERTEAFTRAATYGFAGVSAGISALVAAASPEAFQTFTGSIRLLGASVGQIFVPSMIEISALLQKTAFWFHGLDEGTKKNIASWALWGVGALGAVAVAGTLLRVLASLTIGYTASSLAAGSAALANHGLAGSFNTVTMAAGRALAAIGLLRTIGAVAVGVAVGERMQAADVGGTEAARLSPSERARAPFEAAGRFFGFGGRQQRVREGTDRIVPGAGSGMLTDFNFQSQFTDIEGQWRRLQTEFAGKSPLEAQIEQYHREMLNIIQDGAMQVRVTNPREIGGGGGLR